MSRLTSWLTCCGLLCVAMAAAVAVAQEQASGGGVLDNFEEEAPVGSSERSASGGDSSSIAGDAESSSVSGGGASSSSSLPPGVSAEVPKIIHQTWKTNIAPEKWRIAQESWPRLHPEWTYHLWSDADNDAFIARDFPWFLPVFRGYRHPIERADAVRYFLLYKYGGLYVDLDMEAIHSFDDLIVNRSVALATSANTGKFTNNLMISRRGEPYWELVFEELGVRANKSGYITNEVEILETTGPRLMQATAAMWNGGGHLPLVEGIDSKLVHPCGRCEPIPCTKPGAYVRLWEGNSWHDTISTIGMFFDCHLKIVIVVGLVLISSVVGTCQYRRFKSYSESHRRDLARESIVARLLMRCCGLSVGPDAGDPRFMGYAQQRNSTDFDEDDRINGL